jgi:hypothetical protein
VCELTFRRNVSSPPVEWWLSLLPPTHAGSSLADFSALKMEAIHSSEISVHTRCTRRHIPADDILHSHCCGNLKSYTVNIWLQLTDGKRNYFRIYYEIPKLLQKRSARYFLSIYIFRSMEILIFRLRLVQLSPSIAAFISFPPQLLRSRQYHPSTTSLV